MDFRYKCFAMQALSRIPFGQNAHYWIQKHITKSLKAGDEKYLQMYNAKVRPHMEAFLNYGNTELQESVYYEFGAGWDLFAPLGFSAYGVKRLILVDLSPLLHAEEAQNSIDFYRGNAAKLGLPHMPPDVKPLRQNQMEAVLKDVFRIEYNAPLDARNTGFPSDSVDYIVSNATMEHIPGQDLVAILKECHRLLRAGGVISCVIDYQDHWAYFDKSISVYNYLSYEEADWKRYNPPNHYQNRLRHCDYVRLFQEADFEILRIREKPIREKDRLALDGISVASRFQSYSQEDLLIRGAHIVARRAGERIFGAK